ncbi:unnamed protein product, partial [Ectocarpus sp. 12 AP-2014]
EHDLWSKQCDGGERAGPVVYKGGGGTSMRPNFSTSSPQRWRYLTANNNREHKQAPNKHLHNLLNSSRHLSRRHSEACKGLHPVYLPKIPPNRAQRDNYASAFRLWDVL